MTTFTFGLDYGDYVEELDIVAPNRTAARERARIQAVRDYEPGWKRIIDLPTGGSGGWVEVTSWTAR